MKQNTQQDENLNTILKAINTLSSEEIAETYKIAHELLAVVEHRKVGLLALTLANLILLAYP